MSGAIGPYVNLNFTTVSKPVITHNLGSDGETVWLHIQDPDRRVTVAVVCTDAVKDQIRKIVRVWDWAEECAAHDEGCGFVGPARTKCSEPANHTGQHVLVKAS